MLVKDQFLVSSRTDVGLLRQYNEDSLYVCSIDDDISSKGLLLGVADGMGGHNGGDVASQMAVKTVGEYYSSEDDVSDSTSIQEVMIRLVQKANSSIYSVSTEDCNLSGMGTTLTSVCVRGEEAFLAHVGDSRAYLFRDGVLTQLTDDHSLVAQAVREGILTPEQAARHPQRNIITRALGTKDNVEVDSLVINIQKDDILLLASDGLHGFVTDEQITELMGKSRECLDDMTDDLVRAALEKGGPDNVTAVLVKIGG